MSPDERDKRDRADIQHLTQQPEFTRFIWRVIQSARIFDRAADGSEAGAISAMARRNLGLEILEMVERGQVVSHPDGQPILTLFQAIREEAIQQPGEKPNERRNDRYDRNSDLDDGDAGE